MNKIKKHILGAFKVIVAVATGDKILLENGDALLTESGDNLLLE